MNNIFPSTRDFPPPSDERRFPRLPVLFARVELDENAAAAGIVVNVSEGGLCVQTSAKISGEDPVHLRVHCLPSGWVEAQGRPIWQDQTKSLTGIEFVNLSDQARREITKWLTFGTSLQELRGTWSTEGTRSRQNKPGSLLFSPRPQDDRLFERLNAASETEEQRSISYLGRGHVMFSARRKNFEAYWRSARVVLWGLVVILALAAVWTGQHGNMALSLEKFFAKSTEPASALVPSPAATKGTPSGAAPGREIRVAENSTPSLPVPPTAAIPANATGDMVLQVAAMSSRENANALAESIRRKNLPVFVSRRSTDHFYKVLVGPYSDKATLASAKNSLQTAGLTMIEKHWSAKEEQSKK
jgi:hypothetical protein